MWGDRTTDRVLDEWRYEERLEQGRCPFCGCFQGPDHICPHITQLARMTVQPRVTNNPNRK